MTLAEFVLARVAEQEAWARAEIAAWPDWLARVLAECEAKRRIVNDAGFAVLQSEINRRTPHTEPLFAAALLGKYVLAHLALPDADHQDYQSEWRP